MNLKLHALAPEDGAQHLALAERALADSAATYLADSNTTVAPGTAARLLAEIDERVESVAVVAEAEDEPHPMAFCLTTPLHDPLVAERTACILALWVDPRLRHRGVARALVREVRRLLAERGVTRISARVGHTDDALISMGERWGFVRAWELMVHE
ncbi:MAG: GNAT family N-acetyltransferase [Planctomycetota bacterium]